MSDPLPGVERPKRPPPPKVKPQRPPPPALVSFHSTDGSTRPKLASRVNPKRHMSASAQFSRMVQGNPLFGAMKDEDDTPEDMPVAQVERITDPLGCQTWEEPVTAAVKKGGAEWVGGSIGDEKESMDLFKQTGFIEEEDRMEIPAEDHSSGLTTSASPDSISSDSSEDLFQSLNNPLFPESDFEQTENPSVDDKLHNEASLPDIELTQYTHKDGQQHDEATAPDDELMEYTRKDGKLHGGFTSPDVELKEYPGKGGKLHGGSTAPDVELTDYPGKGGKLHGGSTAPDVELTDYPGKGGKLHSGSTAPDVELTDYPGKGGKLHGGSTAPDVELTDYPGKVGKLHGRSTAPDVEQYHLDSSGTLHGDSGQKVDCNSMPLCEDYYASIPDSACNFGESTPLEEIEEHPLHKDKTHIECNQPIMDMKPQQAIAQQPVSASAGLPADQHTSQSEAIPPLEDVKSRAPAMGSAERRRVGRKVKVKDVFNAMQKDLKAKDPSRADKEELDEPMLSWSLMLTIALINYFYLCCGCSSFLSGFITGVYVFFLLLAGGIGFLSYYEVMKKELREKLRIEAEKEENEKLGAFNSRKLNTVTPLKSELFTVAYSYDYSLSRTPVTHPIRISLNDLRLTIEVEAASVMGSDVSRRFWQFGEDRTIQERNAIMRELDMMSCRVYLAPDEVAKDRKRRWNKKYPICLHVRSGKEQECVLYLFVKVARDKEEWYRRMRNACSGITTAELAAQQTKFYHYMSKYVPKEASQFSPSKEVGRRVTRRRSTQNMQLSQLSNREGNGEGTSVDAPISSTVKQATQMAALSSMAENGGTHVRSTKGVGGTPALPKSYQDRGVHDQAKGLLQSRQSHPVPRPDIPSLSTSRELSLDWVNVLAARLCWDFWHEEKWRKWAMQKIDKKLRRLQRPSFLEELHVTDVQLGSDVPRIKRITHQPRWAGGKVCWEERHVRRNVCVVRACVCVQGVEVV